MRHLAPLAAVCVLVAALLVAPSAPLAADDQATTDSFTPAPEPPPAEDAFTADDQPVAPQPKPKPKARQKRAGARKRKRITLVRAAQAAGTVTIRDFSFSPATIEVKAGETVTWRNDGQVDHTATGKSFDTGVLSKGTTGSFTFQQAGTFSYICSIHPNMKGTVRVTAASSDDSAPAPTNQGSTTNQSAPRAGGGGARLPRSGGELIPIAGLGVLMLAIGAGIARRPGAR